MKEPSLEYDYKEFMRAAAVARIAVELAKLDPESDPLAMLGDAWDLVDHAIELRREVLASGVPLQ